jgi:SAM-dependent MidA family methyltransferase
MAGSAPGPGYLASSDFDLLDGLEPLTHNAALHRAIAREIQTSGPMTFRRFMELALYHATEGYYMTADRRVGRDGDYVTSPEVSSLFGYAVARQLSELWHCSGMPENYSVLEYGAGSGRLARDILHWIADREPRFYQALTYHLIECSPNSRRSLRAWRKSVPGKARLKVVEHQDRLPQRAVVGCLLANELLDSFPVHRVVVRRQRLREIYVALERDQLIEIEGAPSTAALPAYFERLGVSPGEGCVAEVNLAAVGWMKAAAGLLQRGHALLFDYGLAAEQLYAPWRRSGTLLCYRRHEATDRPYEFVGRQDLTSHVDLTTVAESARSAGLRPAGLTSQSRFLLGLGIDKSVLRNDSEPRIGAEYFARRRAVDALSDPAGLGRITALLFSKDAPDCRFSGFTSADGGSPLAPRS